MGIEEYIRNLNAYESQDLVAALLRVIGFHIPFVAPKAKMVEWILWRTRIHLAHSPSVSKYK